MTRIVCIAILLLTGSLALAHDHWINSMRLTDPTSGEWCCNHIDCNTVPAGGVGEVSGGFRVTETQEVIPYTRIIWKSKDGMWWRCRNMQTNSTRCLIGPSPGS